MAQLFRSPVWLVFAVCAVAVSYGLRLVVWWAGRAAAARLEAARQAMDLPRPPARQAGARRRDAV